MESDGGVLARPAALTDAATPVIQADLIAREATAAGFTVVGSAALADLGDRAGERFRAFLDLGRHGDMDWLEAKSDRRRHPNAMWAEARSAIVLGLSYAPDDDPLRFLDATVTRQYLGLRDGGATTTMSSSRA